MIEKERRHFTRDAQVHTCMFRVLKHMQQVVTPTQILFTTLSNVTADERLLLKSTTLFKYDNGALSRPVF